MENAEIDFFNEKLLKIIDNPFRYPHPPYRPNFIIGGENVVNWFKIRFRESIGQGPKVSFVVGVPGAGKSHLLSHIEYLFYKADDRIKGIYAVYDGSKKIDEKELWINLFWAESVLETLRQIIDENKIKNGNIPIDIQSTLIQLLNGTINFKTLDDTVLHRMIKGLSKLLVKEQAGICIAIDNIDEYFRIKNAEYQKLYKPEEVITKVANELFGTIRIAIEGLEQIVVLLACTQDVNDKLMKAGADLTYGRRFETQIRRLQEINVDQSIELVNKYLDSWAKEYGTKLPVVDNEIYIKIDTQYNKLSVYPFSVKAIEYFNKVTRSMPGDIVCICGQCINDMREEKKVSIVEGAAIYYALEEAKKTYSQLILKTDLIESDRPNYMRDVMAKRLNIVINEKQSINSDTQRIIAAIEKFSDELGISKSSITPAKRYTDNAQTVPLSDDSRIWEYKGKRILVKYILSPYPPKGPEGREFGYGKKIETQDKIEILSYLEDEETGVTHVLFITKWVEPISIVPWFYERIMERYNPIKEEWNIDHMYDKIVAGIEDLEWRERSNDMIQHIEKYHAHLLMTLDKLLERTIHERTSEEIRKKDKEAATSY